MPLLKNLPIADILARYPGESASAIGRSYGCSKRPILRILKEHEVQLVPPQDHARRRTIPLPDVEIADRYQKGETISQLAVSFDVSDAVIKKRLQQQSEKLRRRGPGRTYTLNEEFFDVIETEDQAYWLGFLLADARVSRTGAGNWVCRTNLAAVDKHHLYRLAKSVGSDAPVKPGHDGESAYLDLCSVKFCQRLVSLECGPDKTSKHGTPLVPESLKHHFYRGFFDGDGSMFEMPTIKAWRFDVLGSPKFIAEFQNWLMPRAKVSKAKILTPKNSPPSRSLRYTGGPQIERICRVLYQDATLYLPRKYERFQQLLAR